MIEAGAGHVFLCHNAQDKPAVEALARQLLDRGLRPWLDKWETAPGRSWQAALQSAIEGAAAVLVCVGEHGIGRAQLPEVEAALDRAFADPARLVIPLLLPGAGPGPLELPPFLKQRGALDLRGGDAAYRQLFAALGAGLPALPGAGPGAQGSPFRGLEPFEEQHARWFFGREASVARLLAALRERRLLALIGASGSGKSSLVRAGLVPAVRSGELDQSYAWVPLLLRPGPRPLHELALRLSNALGAARVAELREGILAQPTLLADELDRESVRGASELRFLLVIDQFEEVFTLCEDRAARAAFIAALLHAASAPGGRTAVVWTLRSDFLAPLLEHPGVAEPLDRSKLLLGPLSAAELRSAIRRPALIAGLELEPGLEDLLVQGAAGEPADLPLLQFALEELWQRREQQRLTLAAYRRMGGLRGAIARRADSELARFDPDTRAQVRRLFGRLVQLGQGTSDTRRRLPARELLASHPELAAPLESLIRARLLTAHEEEVEVAHEALIREWSTLREWIDADRDLLRLQHELARAASRWQRSGDPSELWSGGRLARALELRGGGSLTLSAPEQLFLTDSANRAERSARELRKRAARELDTARRLAASQTSAARRLRVGLVSAAALLLALAVVAHSARSAQHRAESARAALQAIIGEAIGVAELMIRTVDRDLADLPGTSAVSKRIIDSGAGLLDRLERGLVGPAPISLLRNLAASHAQRAGAAQAVDDVVQARAQYEAALTIWARLAAEHPQDVELQRDWAAAYASVASVQFSAGDLSGSLIPQEKALEIRKRLAEADPANRDLQLALVGSYDGLASVHREHGRNAEARGLYLRSIEILERFVAHTPDDDELQDTLSGVYSALGGLLAEESELPEARRYLERALAIYQTRVQQQPNSAIARSALAWGFRSLGDLEYRDERYASARKSYQFALELYRGMAADDPLDTVIQFYVSWSQANLAYVDIVEGHLIEGRTRFERGRDPLEALQRQGLGGAYLPSGLQYLDGVLCEIAKAEGRFAEAAASAESMLRINQERLALDPNHALARSSASYGYRELGQIAAERGLFAAASRAFEASLELIRPPAAGGPDPELLKRQWALQLGDLGNLARMEGRLADARRLYGEAIALVDEWAARSPSNAQLQGELASHYDGMGKVDQAEGNTAAAVARFQRSLEIHRRRAQEREDSLWAQQTLAGAYRALAAGARTAGRIEEARRALDAALAIQAQLAERDARNAVAAQEVAGLLFELGGLAEDAGQRVVAREYYERSLAEAERMTRDHPTHSHARARAASSQRQLAVLAQREGRLADARQYHERSLKTYEALAAEDSEHLVLRREVAVGYRKLGELASAEGRHPEARSAHQQSVEILLGLRQREPTDFDLSRELVASYVELALAEAADNGNGRANAERAVQLAEENLTRSPTSSEAKGDLELVRVRLAALR